MKISKFRTGITAAMFLLSTSMASSFLLPAVAVAQTDTQAQASMDRAISYMDLAEKKLDGIKSTTSENSIKGIGRQLDRVQTQLDKVPDGAAAKSDAVKRLAALNKRYQGTLEVFASADADRESNIQQLKQWEAAGKTKDDDLFLGAARIMAAKLKFMNIEHSALFKDDQIAEEYFRFSMGYPPTYERVLEIRKAYAGMNPVDVRMHSGGGGGNLQIFLQDGGKEFDAAWETLEKFGAPAIQAASAKLEIAADLAQNALNEGHPGDLLSNKAISGTQTYILNLVEIYNAHTDKTPSLVAQYEALKIRLDQTIGAAQREAFQTIVKDSKPVDDIFSNVDRATIDKMVRYRWNEAYPEDKILQVRIPNANWIRRREPGWRDGLFIMFEYSIVTPYVVVEEPGGLTSMWGMVVEKDHLLDDEITVSFGRLRTKQLDPRYTVLQSAL